MRTSPKLLSNRDKKLEKLDQYIEDNFLPNLTQLLRHSGATTNRKYMKFYLRSIGAKKISFNGGYYASRTRKKFPELFVFAKTLDSLNHSIAKYGKDNSLELHDLFDGNKINTKNIGTILSKYSSIDKKQSLSTRLFGKFLLVTAQKLKIFAVECNAIMKTPNMSKNNAKAIHHRTSQSMHEIISLMYDFIDFLENNMKTDTDAQLKRLDSAFQYDNRYLVLLRLKNRYTLKQRLLILKYAAIYGNSNAAQILGFEKNSTMLAAIEPLGNDRLMLDMETANQMRLVENNRILVPSVSINDITETALACILRANYGRIQDPKQKQKAKKILKKMPAFFCP